MNRKIVSLFCVLSVFSVFSFYILFKIVGGYLFSWSPIETTSIVIWISFALISFILCFVNISDIYKEFSNKDKKVIKSFAIRFFREYLKEARKRKDTVGKLARAVE